MAGRGSPVRPAERIASDSADRTNYIRSSCLSIDIDRSAVAAAGSALSARRLSLVVARCGSVSPSRFSASASLPASPNSPAISCDFSRPHVTKSPSHFSLSPSQTPLATCSCRSVVALVVRSAVVTGPAMKYLLYVLETVLP